MTNRAQSKSRREYLWSYSYLPNLDNVHTLAFVYLLLILYLCNPFTSSVSAPTATTLCHDLQACSSLLVQLILMSNIYFITDNSQQTAAPASLMKCLSAEADVVEILI